MSIWAAFELMLNNRVRILHVLEDERSVDIVTKSDVFKSVIRMAYNPDFPNNIKRLIAQDQGTMLGITH